MRTETLVNTSQECCSFLFKGAKGGKILWVKVEVMKPTSARMIILLAFLKKR